MTPIRLALIPKSTLRVAVCDGLGAIARAHATSHLANEVKTLFGDSLDLDAATQSGHEHENRWDYLLGHSPSGKVIGLEPHSAKTDQVSNVIAKRRAAINHLRGHLKTGAGVHAWYWVASGSVQFADVEKARFRLDQNGIKFIGRKMLKKHLP